jgi:hypothetical protein
MTWSSSQIDEASWVADQMHCRLCRSVFQWLISNDLSFGFWIRGYDAFDDGCEWLSIDPHGGGWKWNENEQRHGWLRPDDPGFFALVQEFVAKLEARGRRIVMTLLVASTLPEYATNSITAIHGPRQNEGGHGAERPEFAVETCRQEAKWRREQVRLLRTAFGRRWRIASAVVSRLDWAAVGSVPVLVISLMLGWTSVAVAGAIVGIVAASVTRLRNVRRMHFFVLEKLGQATKCSCAACVENNQRAAISASEHAAKTTAAISAVSGDRIIRLGALVVWLLTIERLLGLERTLPESTFVLLLTLGVWAAALLLGSGITVFLTGAITQIAATDDFDWSSKVHLYAPSLARIMHQT